jgi:hypothetical protein
MCNGTGQELALEQKKLAIWHSRTRASRQREEQVQGSWGRYKPRWCENMWLSNLEWGQRDTSEACGAALWKMFSHLCRHQPPPHTHLQPSFPESSSYSSSPTSLWMPLSPARLGSKVQVWYFSGLRSCLAILILSLNWSRSSNDGEKGEVETVSVVDQARLWLVWEKRLVQRRRG